MEKAKPLPLAQGGLGEANQRLEKALESLEARIRSLKSRGTGVTLTQSPEDAVDQLRLLGEIEAMKAREQMLELAAQGAFEALGQAAANIRDIIKEEAA
jgi:hypothetical protein